MLRGLQRVYQRPGEAALGVSGRLAADNFARAPVRTAVPVSALAIGVAMTICIAGFIGSFQQSSNKWIEQSVPADLFVTASSKLAGVRNNPMSPAIGDALRKIPFHLNTNDFHFDTEIIVQLVLWRMRILEVPIPTYYGDEICRVNGIKYAANVIRTVMIARAQDVGVLHDRKFDVHRWSPYRSKVDFSSPHFRIPPGLPDQPVNRPCDLSLEKTPAS